MEARVGFRLVLSSCCLSLAHQLEGPTRNLAQTSAPSCLSASMQFKTLYACALSMKWRQPLLTRESARVAQKKTYFDNSKILGFLPGFRFTPIGLTVTEACSAYMQHLKES